MLKVSGCGFICCSASLPWVQQACGLKPTHASKLIKAAEWVNMEHVPHLEGITELIRKTSATKCACFVADTSTQPPPRSLWEQRKLISTITHDRALFTPLRIKADPLILMPYNSSKLATLPRRLAAHLLLAEIQAEARLERAMGLWDATFPDDDTTTLPNPLDSAQSRRAMEVLL